MGLILIAALVLAGRDAVIGVGCGALCHFIPQVFFALRMQRATRLSAAQAARLGLAAEGGKFLLSAVCFALVFALIRPERPGLVFLGFAVLWSVQLIDSVRIATRGSRR
jgi:ATP synthase protein I